MITGRRMRRAVMTQSSSRSGWKSLEVMLVAQIGLDRQQQGIRNMPTRRLTVQAASGKEMAVVLATTKTKKQNKPASLYHKSVMRKEFRKMAKAVKNQLGVCLMGSCRCHGSERKITELDQHVYYLPRGIGIDRTTDYFFLEKVDVIISRAWQSLLRVTRIDRLFSKKKIVSKKDSKKTDEVHEDAEEADL